MAYWLALPRELVGIHDVFHLSQLNKYRPPHDHVVNSDILEIRADLIYEEKPTEIVEHSIKELLGKHILMCKVVWRYHGIVEATWR